MLKHRHLLLLSDRTFDEDCSMNINWKETGTYE